MAKLSGMASVAEESASWLAGRAERPVLVDEFVAQNVEKARSPGDRACMCARQGRRSRSGLRGRCVAKGAFKWPCNPCIRCVHSPFSILEAKLQACVHHGVCRHCR
jgi:hypothetical protein